MDISGYKLGRVLDKDDYCTSYNALDASHGKTVIVKVFSDTLSHDTLFVTHFREVTGRLVNKRLGHNIHLLDAFVRNGSCVLVTNFFPHTTQRHQSHNRYAEDEVIKFGHQLAEALTLLHKQGVVHGGVDLSNINFLDSGDLVLDTIALHRTLPGSEQPWSIRDDQQETAYRAPEADNGLTTESDFFSLGVVLYELLTGHKPQQGNTPEALQMQKESGDYLPLKKQHTHLSPLFDALLSAEPSSRIAGVEGFLSTLSSCREDISSWHESELIDTETESALYENETQATPAIEQQGKRSLIFPVVGVIAAIILLSIFLNLGEKAEQQPVTGAQQSPAPIKPKMPVIDDTPPPPSKRITAITEPANPYIVAQGLYRKGDLQAALAALSIGVIPDADRPQADKLQKKIQRGLQIDKLVETAEKQLDSEKFISPPGDNALETYQHLADLTTGEDQRAAEGMAHIANHYLGVARAEISQNNLVAARNSIAHGLLAIADFPPLLLLQADLTEAPEKPPTPASQPAPDIPNQAIKQPSPVHRDAPGQQAATPIEKPATQAASMDEAKKASLARDKQRRERQQRERRLEAKRLAQERERAARIAAAQRLERKRAEQRLESERLAAQQRELEIKRLLSSAEQQLLRKPLDALSIEKALKDHQALTKIADKDSRTNGLYRRIMASLISLATRHKDALRFSESVNTINRGLALEADNEQLLTLQQEVTEAAEKEKNKTEAIPVIGTF